MSKFQRINQVILGAAMILAGLIFFLFQDFGYLVIVAILALSLLLTAVQGIIYYINMARFMVDGRTILYKSIIILDLSLVILALTNVPRVYVMIYMIVAYWIAAVLNVYRAMERKKLGFDHWRLKMASAVFNVLIAIICTIFINSLYVCVVVYSFGLIMSGIGRILSGFRKTAIVYVQ